MCLGTGSAQLTFPSAMREGYRRVGGGPCARADQAGLTASRWTRIASLHGTLPNCWRRRLHQQCRNGSGVPLTAADASAVAGQLSMLVCTNWIGPTRKLAPVLA